MGKTKGAAGLGLSRGDRDGFRSAAAIVPAAAPDVSRDYSVPSGSEPTLSSMNDFVGEKKGSR